MNETAWIDEGYPLGRVLDQWTPIILISLVAVVLVVVVAQALGLEKETTDE